MHQIELRETANNERGYQNWQSELKRIGSKLIEFPICKDEDGYNNWREEFKAKQAQRQRDINHQADKVAQSLDTIPSNKAKIRTSSYTESDTDLFSQDPSEQGYQQWKLDVENFRKKQRKLAGIPVGKKAIIRLKEYAFPLEGVIQATSKGNYEVGRIQFELHEIESVCVA